MFMTFPEVLILKEIITKKFNKYLHFHDSCGGQYFSFDEDVDSAVKDYIIGYFGEKDASVEFSEDGRSFTVN